jgi:hypothetical protein
MPVEEQDGSTRRCVASPCGPSEGSTPRKFPQTTVVFVTLRRARSARMADTRCGLRSNAKTAPRFCMMAARWLVLLPGAAQASTTTASNRPSESSAIAGKQDAFCCATRCPLLRSGIAERFESPLGLNVRRPGT